MKRFLVFLFNPFLLALWTTLLVLLIFPIHFPKYEAKEIESEKIFAEKTLYIKDFDDLDGDGNSETIYFFYNSVGKASVSIYKESSVIEQWGLYGTFNFSFKNKFIISGDRDCNGIKELYIFTISNDSIFLNCIDNYHKSTLAISKKFIAQCGIRNGRVDPFIIPAEMEDLNGDGIKELIFGIGAGFSLYPRRVFAYDIPNDKLILSPQSSYNILNILQKDINGDSIKEIIPWGYANCNIYDSTVKYHDRSCWLIALDQKLHFLFKPLEFKGQYSNLTPFVLNNKGSKPFLAALFCPPAIKGDSTQLLQFDSRGKIIKKKLLSSNLSLPTIIKTRKGEEFILLVKAKESFELYDTSFTCRKAIKTENAMQPIVEDIDKDGVDEILLVNLRKEKIIIYRNDLTNPVELKFNGNSDQGVIYSIKEQKGKPPQLALQYGSNFYLYQYSLNPRYNLRFGIYASIYLCILLFTLLVRKTQRIQIQKKQEIEKKITEFQLQIIRNQLDPHFTMNAINSIIASIQMEAKDEAREHLMYFSKLHRSLLLSSDQVVRCLQEEIDFTKNYLALEKFRFKDKFDYTIDIEKDVNLELQIPKMMLQIYVENAVKHGLSLKADKGVVSIRCRNNEDELIIEIEDNGVGREYTSTHKQQSTGKGQAVMEQFNQLYNKYSASKISTEIVDLFDNIGLPDGTRVKIIISNSNESKRIGN